MTKILLSLDGRATSLSMSEPIGSEEGKGKYSNLKLKELQNLCKEKGLQVIGRKDTLISRLVEYDAAQESGSSNTPKKIPTSSSSPKKSKVAVTSGESSPPSKTVISTSVEGDETKAHVSPTEEKSEEQRRLERAKRFGTESVEDKKIERAMRFGIVSKETEKAKRRARAERFGEHEGEEELDEEATKKLKRAQRFGLVTADTEAEKKRMRKLRFAT